MGYSSRRGKRPSEYASKSAHGYVIKDESVQSFLRDCTLPKRADDVTLPEKQPLHFEPVTDNPINHVIAIDGGYNEVPVQTEFPSATVCFFQFGALIFSIGDLEALEAQPFIDPQDITKLKNIQRLKFTLPVRNVKLRAEDTLTGSVRRALYEFFRKDMDGGCLMDTLRWFIFQEYGPQVPIWMLASCPICENSRIPLRRAEMTNDFTFSCNSCRGNILLTDVFRLHEAVDDELGAGGILGYVTTTIEQIILVHLIRLILLEKPSLLDHVLFIKDGPLAFFGQTANMQNPMRALVRFLFEQHNLYLSRAGFSAPKGFKVKFQGNKELNEMVKKDGSLDPKNGISLQDATNWFTSVWDNYDRDSYLVQYKQKHGHEWADEDLKGLLYGESDIVRTLGKRTISEERLY